MTKEYIPQLLLTDKDKVTLLRATLEGVRSMALLEAGNGSNAWRKTIEQIDLTLEETK